MYYWNPLESQKWRSWLTSGVTRALSVLTSSPDFPGGPSGPLCPGGPYKKLHALSYAKRKQNIWQASRSWLSLPCVQGHQHLQVDLVVQPDPVWRKIEKQFEDLVKNIKKRSGNDKNKGNKQRLKRLTGEPEGPGGPLVPASPWESKIRFEPFNHPGNSSVTKWQVTESDWCSTDGGQSCVYQPQIELTSWGPQGCVMKWKDLSGGSIF